MPEFRNVRRLELYALAQAGFAVFVLLALWSYAPGDGGFSQSGHLPVRNWAGGVGAWVADFLYFFLGYGAWLVPIACVSEAIRLLLTTQNGAWYVGYLRIAGWCLLLGAFTAQMAWQSGGASACDGVRRSLMPCSAGGWVGIWLFPPLVETLGTAGGQLFLWTVIIICVSVATGFSWLACADMIGRVIWRVTGYMRFGWHRVGMPGIQLPRDVRTPLSRTDYPVHPEMVPPGAGHHTGKRDIQGRIEPRVVEPIKGSVAGTGSSHATGSTDSLPDTDLLVHREDAVDDGTEGVVLQDRLSDVLSEFGVSAEVVSYSRGPVVTCFEVQPSAGVKASRISALTTDLARSMSVASVRVVEVSPGRTTVGIEVPNKTRSIINLRTLLESEAWHDAHSSLSLALGVDIVGRPVVASLDNMPHLLIAGTTGSGKSVAVNAILLSILYKASPQEVRLLMVDPKMLELSVYQGIPHLLTPVITDMKDAISALSWCVVEMERRYRLLATLGVRDIKGYNDQILAANTGEVSLSPAFEGDEDDAGTRDSSPQPLPLIVVVIDEFADMMLSVGKRVEEIITRLAQKARAAGIHLILATQRPSVDVITGLIKANIPSRIAFRVSSKVDSRTVLDQNGAETLLGNGDMLYMTASGNTLLRLHGAMVRDEEVHRVVAHYKNTVSSGYVASVLQPDADAVKAALPGATARDGNVERTDTLYKEALEVVLDSGRASASFVQRRLRIGYNRAARLLEMMEEEGVVSAMNSNGSREIISMNRSKLE